MTRAATRGAIDFTSFDLADPHWWTHLMMVTHSVEAQDNATLLKAALDRELAMVASGRLTAESEEEARKKSHELLMELLSAARPWEGESYKVRKRDEVQGYRQQYIDAFGIDPFDPKQKQWLEQEMSKMREEDARRPRPESDMERVSRLAAERDARQRNTDSRG